MLLEFKTDIAFRKRTDLAPGETLLIRDSQGHVVEVWECIGSDGGLVLFNADGYRNVAEI